jgi:hypothetical protein
MQTKCVGHSRIGDAGLAAAVGAAIGSCCCGERIRSLALCTACMAVINSRYKNMTTLRGARLLAGLLLTALTALSHAADAPFEALKIKNMMPDFWAFEDQVPQLQQADRILRRFREQLIEPNRDIYSKPELRDAITDAGILEYLKEVNADLPLMRTLSSDLEPLAVEVAQKLKKEFPRFDPRLTVVFMPTLHRIDGQYTRLLDQPTLVFGIDAIARSRGPSVDLRVVVAHELFHAYHARMNAALYREVPTPLYVRMWLEGLAAYVSERIVPQASSQQIIGDGMTPIDRSPASMGPVANSIRNNLDSTNPLEQDKYLTYSAATSGAPGRVGYLVGYEIAKALAAKLQLNELTELRGTKLRNLMNKQLEQMSADYLARQRVGNPGPAAYAQ